MDIAKTTVIYHREKKRIDFDLVQHQEPLSHMTYDDEGIKNTADYFKSHSFSILDAIIRMMADPILIYQSKSELAYRYFELWETLEFSDMLKGIAETEPVVNF